MWRAHGIHGPGVQQAPAPCVQRHCIHTRATCNEAHTGAHAYVIPSPHTLREATRVWHPHWLCTRHRWMDPRVPHRSHACDLRSEHAYRKGSGHGIRVCEAGAPVQPTDMRARGWHLRGTRVSTLTHSVCVVSMTCSETQRARTGSLCLHTATYACNMCSDRHRARTRVTRAHTQPMPRAGPGLQTARTHVVHACVTGLGFPTHTCTVM